MSKFPNSLRRLFSPTSGLSGQGVRFALAGGIVALVYLLSTTLLAVAIGMPFEVALPIGFCLAILVHFALQRRFVWVSDEAFALPFRLQASRYLTVVAVQYGITAASTSLLPSVLNLPTEVVYLATALLITATNFIVFRHGIFHTGGADDGVSRSAGPSSV